MDDTHHMRDQHQTRDDVDNAKCDCKRAEEGAAFYVLMNSAEYGTQAWPCPTLEEAVGTLATLARAAEEHRRKDGVQRYFCIKGESFLEEDGSGATVLPPDPCSPDADVVTLLLHIQTGVALRSDSHLYPFRLPRLNADTEESERTPARFHPRRRPFADTGARTCQCACADRAPARRKEDEPQADLRHYPYARRAAHGRLRPDAWNVPDTGQHACAYNRKGQRRIPRMFGIAAGRHDLPGELHALRKRLTCLHLPVSPSSLSERKIRHTLSHCKRRNSLDFVRLGFSTNPATG